MQRARWISLLGAFLLVGCGPVGDSATTVTPPASTDNIRAVLTDLSKTGEMNSGVMMLESNIETLRQTDAAKADALKKGYDELKALNDPNQIKAKAQEMLGKL